MPHSPNDQQVSIASEPDVQYWMYKLHCSRQELHDAVASVGTHVDEVAQYIQILHGDRKNNIGNPG